MLLSAGVTTSGAPPHIARNDVVLFPRLSEKIAHRNEIDRAAGIDPSLSPQDAFKKAPFGYVPLGAKTLCGGGSIALL